MSPDRPPPAATSDPAAGPLAGLLVVALEQAVAAPFCTSRLADAGARVIKIERPEGDFARHYDRAAAGESTHFIWLNRGKESLVLDIKAPEDAALLARLIDRADVFIQNLAPGAAARAGFGSADLLARHPRLIACDISGYGASGPSRDMKAYDLLIQCETGLASITGRPEGPGRVGVSVVDIAAGMYAHAAILEALIARGISGRGRVLQVSLFDAMADWMTVPLLFEMHTGQGPQRLGLMHPSIAPYGAFPTRDGRPVVIAIQNEREWQALCATALGRPEIATDPRFDSGVKRVANRSALDGLVAEILGALSHAEAVARLAAANIAYASVNEVADLARHPHLRLTSVVTPSGPRQLVAPPPIGLGLGAGLGAVPALGQHSDAIRREFAP
ncbi:MAG: CoA transferase [Rhodospirillales bacterium]|nr:CoA transferase [Rhodospirillales bacterium]